MIQDASAGIVLDAANRLKPSESTTDAVSRAPEATNLVPDSYPVPPPPPYEQSAAPLADLAAEMVWERCFPVRPRPIPSSPTAVDPSRRQRTAQQPLCPNVYNASRYPSSADWVSPASMFGVIGGEAKARKFHRECSANTSPLPAPAHGLPDLKKSLHGAKAEVKPAFRRWVRQVLEQTLLSPQVLFLALYYVNSVAGMDVYGDFNGKMSVMPYKMLLAALVLANKTLDDHSYKNSTFANVSSMTVAEVNAVEVALLKALKFNMVPTSEQWTRWLQEVAATSDRAGVPSLEPVLRQLVGAPATIRSSCRTQSICTLDGAVTSDRSKRSIFDPLVSPPGSHQHRVFPKESQPANSWTPHVQREVTSNRGLAYTAPHDHRLNEEIHQNSGTAELYHDQLVSNAAVHSGLDRTFVYAQRHYPVFG